MVISAFVHAYAHLYNTNTEGQILSLDSSLRARLKFCWNLSSKYKEMALPFLMQENVISASLAGRTSVSMVVYKEKEMK